MDRAEYLNHAKARLIQEFTEMVNKMLEDEIFERLRTCPNCLEIVSGKGDFERSILEGSSAAEVDSMLGADDHCKAEEVVASDSDDQIDEELEDEDDDISMSFREAINMLADMNEVSFIISYVHRTPQETSQDEGVAQDKQADLMGKTFIFGEKETLNAMMSQLKQKIDHASEDDSGEMLDFNN